MGGWREPLPHHQNFKKLPRRFCCAVRVEILCLEEGGRFSSLGFLRCPVPSHVYQVFFIFSNELFNVVCSPKILRDDVLGCSSPDAIFPPYPPEINWGYVYIFC